eukprot:s3789_g4.t1
MTSVPLIFLCNRANFSGRSCGLNCPRRHGGGSQPQSRQTPSSLTRTAKFKQDRSKWTTGAVAAWGAGGIIVAGEQILDTGPEIKISFSRNWWCLEIGSAAAAVTMRVARTAAVQAPRRTDQRTMVWIP